MGNTFTPSKKRKSPEDSDEDIDEIAVSERPKLTGCMLVTNCCMWQWISDGLSIDDNSHRKIKATIQHNMWMSIDHRGRISCVSSGDPPDEKLFDSVVDAGGHLILPGLIDAHIHVMLSGENSHYLDLSSCNSIDDLKASLKSHHEMNADLPWIIGINWDQSLLSRYPTRYDLDSVCPETPVFLWRACWHIGVANTLALRRANINISDTTFNVPGGEIDVDASGPTGVLRENAVQVVLKAMGEHSEADKKRFIEEGLNNCLRRGLTAVQTNDEYSLTAYSTLMETGDLPLRVFLTPSYQESAEEGSVVQTRGIIKPGVHTLVSAQDSSLFLSSSEATDLTSASSFLTVERVKLFVDGSLGAETAAIKDEDNEATAEVEEEIAALAGGDKPEVDKYRGILLHKTEALTDMVRDSRQRGYRLEIHCIGDMAAEQALTALENAGALPAERPVLTHCQVLNPDLIQRMKSIGAIANIQPSFVPTDMRWVMERLSTTQIENSYCWKTLLQSGVWVAGGSDAPIESCSPFTGIYDAMFRTERASGEGNMIQNEHASPHVVRESYGLVFRPSEKLSLAEALWTYTVGAAYAANCENVLGQLKECFAGDFVVVDIAVLQDISLLRDLEPEMVVVGGSIKFCADEVGGERADRKGIRVSFPRGQLSGYRPIKRTRQSSTNTTMGGPYIPGKNGPRGLIHTASRGTPRNSIGLPRANGFCACWLRGKRCSAASISSSGMFDKPLPGLYCQEISGKGE